MDYSQILILKICTVINLCILINNTFYIFVYYIIYIFDDAILERCAI